MSSATLKFKSGFLLKSSENRINTDSRPAKRLRRVGELPTSFDLLWLYQSDLGDRILSYATGADLCTLETLNKQFKSLVTTDKWKVVTKDRFGMNNGKEGWKIGTSFLRPPVFVHNLSNANEPESHDSPRIVTNDNIVVNLSEPRYVTHNDIKLRDASTLKQIHRHISNVHENAKVSICGRVGSEIVVASTKFRAGIEAEVVHWNHDEDGDIPPIQVWQYDGNSNGVETIGCETHLVTAHDGMIRLYEVKEELEWVELENGLGSVNELFTSGNEIRVDDGVEDENVVREMKLAWGPDKTHFIVGCAHKICVLKLDASKNEITLVKTIDTEWEVTNVALAEDYIVASSKDKKVHIWNRSTGDKMVYEWRSGTTSDALCDVESTDRLRHNEGLVRPLLLSCHGHILVSTSHIGCAICVWDMKTGELLKRHNEANEEDGVKMLSQGGKDVTDMVHLKKLNAFICTGEYENMWAFPTNQRQYDMAATIWRKYYE